MTKLNQWWQWGQIFFVAGLLVVTLFWGVSCYIDLAQDVGRPFPGVLILLAGRIGAANPPWWPGIVAGNIDYDSQLREIDGQEYGRRELPTIMEKASQRGAKTVEAVFELNEQKTVTQLPVVEFSWAYYFDLIGVNLITGFSLWLLAVVVFVAKPQMLSNRLIAIIFCSIALNQWLSFSMLFWNSLARRGFFNFIMWDIATASTGSFVVHLTFIFPKVAPRWRYFVIYPLHLYTAFIISVEIVDRYLYNIHRPDWLEFLTDNFLSGHILFSSAIVFMLSYYVWLRLTERNSIRIKKQLNIIIMGLIITLPPLTIVLCSVIDRANLPSENYVFGVDIRYLNLAVPLAVSYAILRYQSLSINLQTANTVILFVIVMVASAMLSSFGASLWRWVDSPELPMAYIPLYMPLFLVGLVSGLFWSRQSLPNGLLGRLFYRQTLNYGATSHFGERLLGKTDLDNLPNQIALALSEELELEQAAVWLLDEGQFTLAGQAGQWAQHPPQTIEADSVSFDTSSINPVTIRSTVIIPLIVSGETIGLLGLGKRWDEAVFDNQDQQIISLIAQQSALFLLTAQQINILRQVPRHVSEAQERERDRLAQELHDETQQFLGRLPFFLETSRRAISYNPARTAAMLERSISDVEEAAQALRQIRNSLAPGQLHKELVLPLHDLIQRFTLRTKLPVDSQLNAVVDTLTSIEQRHALYRVIQQALDNAAAHAHPSRITVHLTAERERITFSVQDDGQGFSETRRTQAQDDGRFGLVSMQNRISTLGGVCQIESVVGQGTTVRGWLPLFTQPS